jgi:hypothetical protein
MNVIEHFQEREKVIKRSLARLCRAREKGEKIEDAFLTELRGHLDEIEYVLKTLIITDFVAPSNWGKKVIFFDSQNPERRKN